MPKRVYSLPPDVADVAHRDGGVLLASRARATGITADRLARLVGAGLLVKIGPGQYVPAEQYAAADEWRRFKLRAVAFGLSRKRAFLTGWAGAVCWKLPTIGRPPDVPTAIRHRPSGYRAMPAGGGRVLAADLPPEHLFRINEVPVMSQEWVVADLARTGPIPHALVVADAVAREGRDIHDAVRHMQHWPGVARARWVAEYANPLAETPIETFGRFTVIEFGLPMFVSNAWVGENRPEFRLDGLWPYHWAGQEADGAIKYNNRPDAAYIVNKQADREWRLRRLGLDLVRFNWRLAAHQRKDLALRFGRLLRDNPVRDEPMRWWKHVPGVGPVEPEPEDWPSPYSTQIVLPAGWDC